MTLLVKPVMTMNGMINSGEFAMRLINWKVVLMKVMDVVSDEIYDSRNTIIHHCDKSAIDKHLNRLVTVNV